MHAHTRKHENSQQPVDGHQQADVLCRETHCGEDEEHGDQTSTGNTGCPDARQSGRHAAPSRHVIIVSREVERWCRGQTVKCFFT